MKISRPYLYLHFAILLFGITGIMGKLITLSGANLTWYRMVITLISLCFIPGVFLSIRKIPVRIRGKILLVGVLVALHWVTFFGAIKLSNVSITLSCMASTAFFTSLIEPWLVKRPFRAYEALLGGLVILGFVFIFGFTAENMYVGILTAILSALLAATFGTLNKTLVANHDVFAITLLEFVAGVAFLSVVLPIYSWFSSEPLWVLPTQSDWLWLLILALGCTTLAFTLTMYALRYLSAFTTALALNLEPIYAIVLAWVFFHEHKDLSVGFYAGAGIIILAVFINPILQRRFPGQVE